MPNWQFFPLPVRILEETISVTQLWTFDIVGSYYGPNWYSKHKSNSFWLCSYFMCSIMWEIRISFKQSLQFIILLAHFLLCDCNYLWANLSLHWSQANFIVLISLLAIIDCFTTSFYLQLGQFKWFLIIKSLEHFSHIICPQQRVSTALFANSVHIKQTKFWSTSSPFIGY